MTLPILAISAFIVAASCAGELPTISTPLAENFSLISALPRTWTTLSLRSAIRAGGVPAGALMKESSQPSVNFEIMRRDEAGGVQIIAAEESTAMQPGVVVRVNARVFDFN